MSTGSPGSASSTTAPSTATSTPAPTTGTASTGTASTGTYPTDVPAAARANTTEGVEAFATYYLGLVNLAYTSPKVGLLSPLSNSSCTTCAAFEETATHFVNSGQRYDGPVLTHGEVSTNWQDSSGSSRRVVDVVVHQNAANIVDAGNRSVQAMSAKDLVVVMTISRSANGWMVDLVQMMG